MRQNHKLRVGVLFGGRSGEHEVSLVSGRRVMEALDRDKYDVVPLGISKEGRWLIGGDPLQELTAAASALAARAETVAGPPNGNGGAPPLPLVPRGVDTPVLRPAPVEVDVIFPCLHGPFGEDGTVQGLLELANIPYVGAGVTASAAGMDKVVMKALFQHAGLPIVDYQVVPRWQWERERAVVLEALESRLGYPCFVKPANLGSSVGVSKARDRRQLEEALDLAALYDRKLVVERGVDAREFEVGVLGNDDPEASVPGEVLTAGEFYDYHSKYLDSQTTLVCPADLPVETVTQVRRLAVSAFQAIDCAGMARVDFFLDRHDSTIYVNEINTIPGLTPMSAFPTLWERCGGISFAQLCDRLIELALDRHQDQGRNVTSYEPH